MTAIIVTPEQSAALAAARQSNDIRVLEPRRLEDGRLILNADVLDDPHFTDPAKPWAPILAGQEIAVEEPKEGEPTKIDDATRDAITNGLAQARSAIVALSDGELSQSEI